MRQCPFCGEEVEITTVWLDREVPYGCPVETVLKYSVPVRECRTCLEMWTDHIAEAIADTEVRLYLQKRECAK